MRSKHAHRVQETMGLVTGCHAFRTVVSLSLICSQRLCSRYDLATKPLTKVYFLQTWASHQNSDPDLEPDQSRT